MALAPIVALAASAPAASPALADDDFTTTDLAVSCDYAAAPAVWRAARAFRAQNGVRVRIFPTAPNLLLPQLQRQIQNDIILTRVEVIDAAEQLGLVKPGGRVGPWRNRLVLAEAAQQAGPDGFYAVPDATPASEFDGAAVLKAMNITPGRIVGVLNTDAVVWALLHGQARSGLVFQSDIAAHETLRAVAPVPDGVTAPIVYGATMTTLASRINPEGFVRFLGSPAGMAELKAGGLEPAS
jgi:ABC-type molybdate transport system substrate-binding protein